MTNRHRFSGAVMSVAHISKTTLSPASMLSQNHNCVNNRLTDCCFHLYGNIQRHAGIDIFFLKCLPRAKHVISRAGPVGRSGGQGESERSELAALMTRLRFSCFRLSALDDSEALLEVAVDNCCIDLFYYHLVHSILLLFGKKKKNHIVLRRL